MNTIIEDLLKPASFPDETKNVSLVQTHISMVFIGDDFVYKLKKPVDFGFLDFSTLEKRHFYCQQELTLNQRLSKDLYLGVLPVFFDGKHYKIGDGEGEIVEYAVKMKRIPDERLMISLFNQGGLRREHLKTIAEVLSRFHQGAETSPEIEKFGEPDRFRVNTDENFEQTKRYLDKTIQEETFDALVKWTGDFYLHQGNLFKERIARGKIRDCHGDLHMEHICLTDPISIFDCIEFNDRFRYSDTIADVAFLIMDLEYRGGMEYAGELWRLYSELTGEADMGHLLTFYKVYRAYVRGKVNSFQLDDERIAPDEREKAAETARRYFQLAGTYIS